MLFIAKNHMFYCLIIRMFMLGVGIEAFLVLVFFFEHVFGSSHIFSGGVLDI